MGRLNISRARLRAVAAIGGGTLAGQLILVAATPILSRIYPPTAFGAFSSLVAVASVVGASAALKFDAGIVLPSDDRTAGAIARLAILSSLATSAGTAAVLAALELLGMGSAWERLSFAPLWGGALVFLTALFTTLTQVALRKQAYGMVARRSPIQAAGTVIGQVALGLAWPTPAALLTGLAVGRLSGLTPLIRSASTLLKQGGVRHLTAAREYWRLPALLAPSALLNALGAQIPILSIAALFGAHEAGEYGMAQRVVYIPLTLIGTSVAQVFAAELAKHIREGGSGAFRAYLRSSALLTAAAIPVATAIFFIGPLALPPILGDAWKLAGELCQPLAVAVGIALVVTPTSQVYTVFQSALSLGIDASRILLTGAALFCITWFSFDVLQAAWALVLAQAANYMFTWIVGIRITMRSQT